MKHFFAVLILCSLGTRLTFAQGTVNFQNIAVGLNAPVILDDGVTRAGAGYTAAFLAGPTPTTLALIATTPLLSNTPGYFLGGVQTITTVAGGGTADILVEVWSSVYGSFPAAQASGMPNAWVWSDFGTPFTVVTGNPNTTPPGLPAILTGLSFGSVPEPSFLALAVLGGALLILVHRRSKSPVQ